MAKGSIKNRKKKAKKLNLILGVLKATRYADVILIEFFAKKPY